MVDIRGKQEEYVAIDDVAGLVALVQMGVLELHPWPAREDNLERPDQLVFDLDPGEGVEWKAVVQGARDLRERLETAGLKTYSANVRRQRTAYRRATFASQFVGRVQDVRQVGGRRDDP